MYLSTVHQLTTCSLVDTVSLVKEFDLFVRVYVCVLQRANERQGVSTYVPAQFPNS